MEKVIDARSWELARGTAGKILTLNGIERAVTLNEEKVPMS